MAITYPITLSTTVPNNNIGLLKIRQADEETQTLVVQTLEDAIPKSYEGLQVFFCARIGQTAGLGIIEQKLTEAEMTDPKNGKLEYTFRAEDWQILGRQTGYFSFRKMTDDHTYVQQFSTRDFTYEVTKSIYSDGIKEVKKDGSTYIWTIEDLKRQFEEYIATGKTDWEDFVNQNKDIIESIDPGGKMLSEITDARGGNPSLADRLKKEEFIKSMDSKRIEKRIRDSNVAELYKTNFPTGFTWQEAPISIWTDGKTYTSFFQPADLRIKTGATYYCDYVNGLDTNAGTSESAPFKTLNKALSVLVDGDTLIVLDTFLTRNEMALTNIVLSKNVSIIAKNKCQVLMADPLSYTKYSDGVYKTTRSNVARVVDFEKKIKFKDVSSLSECQSTPGTWYQNGSDLYVHCINGEEPTLKKIFVLLNAGTFISVDASSKNISVYLKGFEFIGGVPTLETKNSSTTKATVLLDGISLLFSCHRAKGAAYIAGANCYSKDCTVAYADEDGFDYQELNGQKAHFIEVDCHAFANGSNIGVQGDNGSTSHTDAKGIRVGGMYYGNLGPNIADVIGNTQTLNYNVTTFDSKRDIDFPFNFQISDGEMWIYNSETFGTVADIYCPTGGTVYIDDKTVYYTLGGSGSININQ